MKRAIFHIRVRDFEVKAERTIDLRLRSRALAIISSHHANGTVVALSDEARQEGISPGMKVSLVRKMSHNVALLPFNDGLYSRMHNYLFKVISAFSPIVEPSRFGQHYLDMSGMGRIYRSNRTAADMILQEVVNKVQLDSFIGISANKLVSRIATEVVTESLYEVESGNEPGFLAPLSSGLLPVVVEPAVDKIVRFLLLNQVLHLQKVTAEQAVADVLFGKHGKKVTQQAWGMDSSAVVPPFEKPHIVKQEVLKVDTNDKVLLESTVQNLAGQIGYDLRMRKQEAKSLRVEIHYTDGFRSAKAAQTSSNDDRSLNRICLELFHKANYRRNRIRTIIIDATNLRPAVHQLEMFTIEKERDRNLSRAIDLIKEKFGVAAIQSASALLN